MSSAILAQSLMMVNLPLPDVRTGAMQGIDGEIAHDNTVLPNVDVVPNRRCLYDGARAYVDVVADLHRIVVEVPAIRLVWRSALRPVLRVLNRT